MLSASVAAELRAEVARRKLGLAALTDKLTTAAGRPVTRQWVTRRLTGRALIGLDDLVLFADALDVDAADVLHAAGLPGAGVPRAMLEAACDGDEWLKHGAAAGHVRRHTVIEADGKP